MDALGLMYYNARWYDPQLGRFTSADSIVPDPGKPIAFDRYAYVYNNPLRYTDPSGYFSEDEIDNYLKQKHGKKWKAYRKAWESDGLFWEMLIAAENGDLLFAPESDFSGEFIENGNTFDFDSERELCEFQGSGPYVLQHETPAGYKNKEISFHEYYEGDALIPFSSYLAAQDPVLQPIYDYSTGVPLYTGYDHAIYFTLKPKPQLLGKTGMPFLVSGVIGKAVSVITEFSIGGVLTPIVYAGYLNNSILAQEKAIAICSTDQTRYYYSWSGFKQTGYNNFISNRHGR